MTLSLDPSLVATGYALFDGTKIIDVGCIQTKSQPGVPPVFDDNRRIEILIHSIVELLEKYPIDLVKFEIPIGFQSYRAAAALSQAKAVVFTLCISRKLKYIMVLPSSAKKAASNDQFAEKETMYQDLIKKYPRLATLTKDWPAVKRLAASDAVAVFEAEGLEIHEQSKANSLRSRSTKGTGRGRRKVGKSRRRNTGTKGTPRTSK